MISLTSPTRTRAHDWPAGVKLASLCAATVTLFFIESAPAQAAILIAVALAYLTLGVEFFVAGLRQLKLLWPFVLIVGIWHVWISELELGAIVIFRMLSAVALANLVTMTTRLTDMIDVVHMLTKPLVRFGLKSRVIELAIAMVIRLTPVLVQKGSQLSLAWKARSNRAPRWNIILPFTVLALDDADQVAEALRARGGFISLEET